MRYIDPIFLFPQLSYKNRVKLFSEIGIIKPAPANDELAYYMHLPKQITVEKVSTLQPAAGNQQSRSFDRFFDAAKKNTVIRLRWPLVILSSYLLYYTPSDWLTPTQVQATLILYLLSHTTLYFLADELFDSPYFYGPLLVFDTIVLLVVFSTSGTASPDFYVACLFTVIVSCICNDARGLLLVTLLAPLAYAYFVFHRVAAIDPHVFLRLPFPFVISLFYGYFAQVERLRRTSRIKDEQVKKQQKAAEETRRQWERLEVLHQVNKSVTSTIDRTRIIESFLETALIYLPYAAALVRLRHPATGKLETVAVRGFKAKAPDHAREFVGFIDQTAKSRTPVTVRNVFTDTRVKNLEFFEEEGLVSLLAVPFAAGQDALGCAVWLTRSEHSFNEDEVDFLSTLTSQAEIAVHHAELYDQSRRQADELRNAHKIKDEFLKVVSTQLKTPLNVITGYSDMFLQGALGAMTPIQEKAIEAVARQSKELHRLISTVLQVSDIEAGTLRLELQEINLWEFFAELRSLYDRPLVKEVKLVWSYPSDLPSIQSDRGKLRRILENLIDNAIKFTERGSVRIVVRYLYGSKMLEVKIVDTGVGIPHDQIPRIFERFQQVPGSHAMLYNGGVGLGLYLVKKYLDVLGGKIQVDSRPGEGSIFSLQIPAPLHISTAMQEQLLLPTAAEYLAADSR